MPELAELKITADYINEMCDTICFQRIVKNPVHKGKEFKVPFHKFRITAESRGKELMLYLKDDLSDRKLNLLMTMGMSGHFVMSALHEVPKHAHLIFYAHGSVALSFVDVRRFGKWKLVENDWSDNRGPDPTVDYEAFFNNIDRHILSKEFKKPIHEVMMNQKYFNGIGNYLRAEILYRADVDPFMSAEEAITKQPLILKLCQTIPMQAYRLGGGSIKDWQNPYDKQPENWGEFMKCYGNKYMANIIDKTGRRFWFDPKWIKQNNI